MRPKFKSAQPNKKLKPFFWNKVNPTNSVTVWHDLPPVVQIDLSDLEATFVVDNTPTSPSLLSPQRQNVKTVLDISRANNIGGLFPPVSILDLISLSAIMLKGINMDNTQIHKCLLEVDDARLTTDDLRAIKKQLPTPEEVSSSHFCTSDFQGRPTRSSE